MVKSARNKTLELSPEEKALYSARLLRLEQAMPLESLVNRTIRQDCFSALPYLPDACIDLVVADPPYNMDKIFGTASFKKMSNIDYETWLETWFVLLLPKLKKTASLYLCGDWQSSTALQRVLERHCSVQNRITWEREKGRGAKNNWKNASEDIWFATVSDAYYFNVEAVKLKKKVLAPYRDAAGQAKDWENKADGNFRLTHPSNLWTDLTVPFWSMPENTPHPTQKPEKLLAKIILASSQVGDIVFDPFLGSGTSSVVAKKLGRRYLGIELDLDYACLAEKRLALAETDKRIQGYAEGVFFDRNF